MTDVRLKTCDLKPHLTAVLDGGPVDWTGATAVIAIAPAGGVATNYPVTLNTATKVVEYDWTDFDTTVAGEYHYEWIITFPDADEMSAPGEGYETFFISVSLGAPGDSYCSLSDLKAELAITDNSEDARLLMFMDVASRQVENLCRQTFYYEAAAVEYHAVQNYPRLILNKKPVISITSIIDTYGDATVAAATYEIENAYAGLVWFYSIPGDDVYRFSGIEQPVAARRARYQVTYAGGYQTPNQSGTGAPLLPSPIRYVTTRLAAGMYLRQGVDPRVQREHLLEASVWYSDTQFQSEVDAMLRPYRAPVMV